MLKRYIPQDAKRILSIASGLDNSLAFLEQDDVEVLAIDSNPSQVYLSRLKATAIKHLEYEEFLMFMGFKPGNSLALYERLRPYLEEKTLAYFDSHSFLIENKLIHAGRFEYYFHLFRTRILPHVASKKRISQFMELDSLGEQRKFYKKYINTWRFKLLFKIFFSKKVMAKLGRDKNFFTYNKGGLAKRLKRRVDLGLLTNLNKENPYLQYAMLNEFKELPYYAKEDVFYKIKKNIQNIKILEISFEDAIKEYSNFDFMNLSDIFEYMPKDIAYFEPLIQNACSKEAILAYWNMINPRYFSGFQRKNNRAELALDRAMYYQDFIVYEVHHD